MNLLKELNSNNIIIIPQNIKKKLLEYINKQNELINIKIITNEELKKLILFDYDEKAIFYIKEKYNLSYKNSKEYIENLYFILDDEITNNKLKLLKNIKQDLLDNNLIQTNNIFLKSITNKNILIFGFDYINKYYNKLIDKLKKYANVTIINKTNNYNNFLVYTFDSINEEIEFIANNIIEKKLDLSKTYIYGINKDNENVVKRIFDNYNLNINFSSSKTLFDTIEAQNFLNNLENYEEALNNIKNHNIKENIINILNEFYFIDDKSRIKDEITEKFKTSKLPNIKYINAINEVNIFDNLFNEDEHVYIINFNREYIPTIYKNEDFINDEEKPSYLENTNDKNNTEIKKWKIFFNNIKNLTITSSKQGLIGALELSPLISEFNMTVEKKEYTFSKYSNKSNKYNLALSLDNYVKFNIENESLYNLLGLYPNNNYLTYNNKYQKVNLNDLNLKLSYSKINTYYECAFKYYLENILRINTYKDTFDTWTGSLCHHILSKINNENFDFEQEKKTFIKDNPFDLTLENEVFLNKILNELTTAISYIKSLHNITKYKDIECEKEITFNIDDVSFTGIIDKIMKYEDNIVLIDYKTGNPNIDLRYCKHGLNLQLPIYLYLIKTIYPESNIVGIYLQHILKPIINKDDKSPDEIYENHLKLEGYTLGNEEIISNFDPTYENSMYIKGIKLTQNGFARYSKVLTKDEFNNIEVLAKEKINECIENIKNAKFDINPKICGKNNLSCEFCPFKSICFVEEKDFEYISLEDDLPLGDDNYANMD